MPNLFLEMIQSALGEADLNHGKKVFVPAHKKIFQVVKESSIDKLAEINILKGLEYHPRTGVRELRKEVEIDDDVYATTTKITTKEIKERATGMIICSYFQFIL